MLPQQPSLQSPAHVFYDNDHHVEKLYWDWNQKPKMSTEAKPIAWPPPTKMKDIRRKKSYHVN